MWKIGYKHFRQNLSSNVLLVVQFVMMYIVAIAVTSSIVSRYKEYIPVRQVLNVEGDYYYIRSGKNPETNIASMGSEEIADSLKGDVKVLGTFRPWFQMYIDGMKSIDGIIPISYDEQWLNMYAPELSCGQWFTEYSDNSDILPIVISENQWDYTVGDYIDYTIGDESVCQAVVIGVLKEGTPILDISLPNNIQFGAANMYCPYYYSIEQKMLIIIPETLVSAKFWSSQPNGHFIVLYPNGVSESDREYNDNFMKTIGMTLFSNSTDYIKSNSINYIYEKLKMLLPIAMSIFVLVSVSVICMGALFTKRQIHNFAIYYICGLQWKQCALINIIVSTLITMTSFLITLVIISVFKPLLSAYTIIQIGFWQLLTCLIVSILHIMFSALLPIQILRNQMPSDIMRENNK